MTKKHAKFMKRRFFCFSITFLVMLIGLVPFVLPKAIAGPPGTWEYTGSMNEARSEGHSVTLLPNGKVLIAGGWAANNTSSAEIYDPALGTFTATGSMGTPRSFHTATLLPNGKVLIAGGYGPYGFLSSAEIYDPDTGVFTATGSMGTARYVHTATLLQNGTVLIAGGRGANITSSAEIYDPGWGTFAATGSMGTARIGHTATLLPNGKVLIAGGNDGSGNLDSAELFNGSSFYGAGAFLMGTARSYHTATLLPNGKVLIAGGGWGVTSAEIYDPDFGTYGEFTYTTGKMGTVRGSSTATLLPNGKVLITGGLSASYVYLSSAELYDPATRTFTSTGSIGTARAYHVATILPTGKVLIAGGHNYGTLSSAELYTPSDKGGVFIPAWPMKTPRHGHTATLLNNGKVLIAGGYNSNGSSIPINSAELYDPATGKFTYTNGSMKRSRYGHTATLLNNGKVLITGGRDNTFDLYYPLASAELYDPATDTFTFTAANMVYSREDHTATLLSDGSVLIAGGRGASGYLSSAELYNPNSNTFYYDSSMRTARRFHTAILLNNGEVLIAGGKGYDVYGNYVSLNTAERYPGYSFLYTSSMSYQRVDHTATLLPNGKVLIANSSWPELYDSNTQSFSPTPSMLTNRYSHTATLLQNGDVLFAGGESWAFAAPASSNIWRSSAEIYDPVANTFTYTYPMDFIRKDHTATLLQNGKVLIAGGVGSPQSAVLYQPISYVPDLIVQSIATNPVSPAPGQNVNVTVTVKNQGSGPAGSFYIDFYKDLASAPGPVQWGDFVCFKTGLAAGATDTCSGTVSYASAGTYSMWAQVDTDQMLAESNEANNIFGPQNIAVCVLNTYYFDSDGDGYGNPYKTTQACTQPAGYVTNNTDCNDKNAAIRPNATEVCNSVDDNCNAQIDEGGVCGVPDLTVTTVTGPTTGLPASTITVGDTTKNNGPGIAPASGTIFYWSADSTLDALDTYLGSRKVPALAALATNTGTITVTVPAKACSGTFYIIAKADADNLIAETIETNNTRSKTIKTGPDLIIPVALIIAPTTGGAGQITNVEDTTKNNGGCFAEKTTITELYLSKNNTWDKGDINLNSKREVPGLAAGASSTGTTPVLIPAGIVTGSYYIIAKADAYAVLPETSETNNTKGKLIKIGPDLIISTIAAPASASTGATISITDTTKNSGGGAAGASTTKLYLSINTTYDVVGDTYLGSRGVPNLAAGAVNALATSVTIPAGTPIGTHYIIAVSDATGVVVETNETNNNKYKLITIN